MSFWRSPSDKNHVPSGTTAAERSDAYTLPLLCAGIAIIACCLLIPAADENRQLAYESASLQLDKEQISRQVELNNDFLHRVADDPALLERLAQRQMKLVRQGTGVLDLNGQASSGKDLSPFLLTTLPPPLQIAEYQPMGGTLGAICRNPHLNLYLMGVGLLLVAFGLVVGAGGLAKLPVAATVGMAKSVIRNQPFHLPLGL